MTRSKIILVIFIMLTVFGLGHWFCYLSVSRSVEDSSLLKTIYFLGWLSIPLGFASTKIKNQKFLFFSWVGYIWMGFFAIHIFFSIIEFSTLFFIDHNYSYWVFLASLGTSFWALHKGLKFPSVITHQVSGPEEIKNFKIVQISDLHIGMLYLNQAWLKKIVDKINEQNPDVVAITGDLVEGDFFKISKMLEPLKKIKANCGVFYITGNHEYIHPGDWEQCLRDLKITSLHNENKIIEFKSDIGSVQKILIAGVPDRMVPRFRQDLKSEPDLALRSVEKTIYKILLAHEPSSIFDLKNEACDLMLTGHTHGGQIFPFHLGVRLVQPMVRGFKKFGQTLVFNHQGTGFWGPPMRWFSRSEIVVLKF